MASPQGARAAFCLHIFSAILQRCLQVNPGHPPLMYAGSWCGVNEPMEGVLIDSFPPLSLTPVPRVACISPGSPQPPMCPPLSFPPLDSVRGQVAGRVLNRGQDHTLRRWRRTGLASDIFWRFAYCIWLCVSCWFWCVLIHVSLSPPPPNCVHSIRSVMQKYLEERDELTFDKIFNQKIGKCQHFFYRIKGSKEML